MNFIWILTFLKLTRIISFLIIRNLKEKKCMYKFFGIAHAFCFPYNPIAFTCDYCLKSLYSSVNSWNIVETICINFSLYYFVQTWVRGFMSGWDSKWSNICPAWQAWLGLNAAEVSSDPTPPDLFLKNINFLPKKLWSTNLIRPS